jgi:hypothetical protein
MAIKVGTSGTTAKTIAVAGSTTQIKKVVVGTPVKRVTGGGFNVNNIVGINTTGAVNGSLLIYNSSTADFEANIQLQEQIINGGNY